jgi:2-polyprenyl-6-methoxyphenol hydroxylase-like FAD-dependent oxidoreductase
MMPRVLIIGGGIAGCSAAIALAEAGCAVEVIERESEWRFQSSGIFVYCNGLVSLQNLGVLPDILHAGFTIPGGRNPYFEANGTPIVTTVYPEGAAGVPAILGIKRAELHRVLAARMAALGVPVRLGTTATALDPDGRAVLSDGTSGRFDLVIGADGLRSQVRRMIGIDVAPRYTGFGVWRAVHDRPAEITEKIMMMGRGKRFGIMPISADKLYTFGTVAEPKEAFYPPADWPRLMRERFAEFGGPAAPLIAELGPESEVLYTAVEEVALPLPWHRGRVLLIGDAAHASTPFMGQGGAMAMADAVVLGRLVAEHGIDGALAAFGPLRAPACRFVQDASRRVGEAGAAEDATVLATRTETMRANAQKAVDDFYTTLARLSAAAETTAPAAAG